MLDFGLLEQLTEKLISLASARKDADAKRFELAVTNIYDQLGSIHRDYLTMFDTCLTGIESRKDLSDVINVLHTARLESEGARRTIAALVVTFANDDRFAKYRAFLVQVGDYMRGDEFPMATPTSGLMVVLMAAMKANQLRQMATEAHMVPMLGSEMERLGQEVEDELARIRKQWIQVSESFANAQADSI